MKSLLTLESFETRENPSTFGGSTLLFPAPDAAESREIRHQMFSLMDRQPAATGIDSHYGTGILRSTDAGSTW